ncbi:MAG: Lrp/AsnC family transcriptional regulator [Desulfobacterales bacterium]|nr:Lrp/AsnC family transcriptional regulator [Desulfobacterales bacterium]
MSNRKTSKELGVPEPTIRNRVQKLINERIIRVATVPNTLKIISGLSGNLRIKSKPGKVKTVVKKIKKIDEIWFVARLFAPPNLTVSFL